MDYLGKVFKEMSELRLKLVDLTREDRLCCERASVEGTLTKSQKKRFRAKQAKANWVLENSDVDHVLTPLEACKRMRMS